MRTDPESLKRSTANKVAHSPYTCARERAPRPVCLLFLPFTTGEWLTLASNLKLTKINISSRSTHTRTHTHTGTHVCTRQYHKEKDTISTQSHFVCFL